MAWTCPACERQFGRAGQWHACTPAGDIAVFFATRPSADRATYDAIRAAVDANGPVVAEATAASVMFKRSRTFASVKRRRAGLTLEFLLSRELSHPRVVKTLQLSAHRFVHYVDVATPADIDRDLKAWLAEAYASSPP